MNILFLSHEYPPVGGGGGNACRHLATVLANRGHTVDVVTVQYDDLAQAEGGCDGRLMVFRVPAKRSAIDHCSAAEMFDYLRLAKDKASELCKRGTYDACLCFFGIPSGVLARGLKRKYGIPYIVRFGGGDIPGFQDRFRQLYRITAPQVRRIWKDAEGLVANSEGLRQFAIDFCSDYPIQVINNGVDTEVFAPDPSKEYDPETIRLLTVSRLIPRKGLQDVIPYIGELEERTGKKIHWTIVGDGPFRETLETLAVESGVQDRITWAGQRQKTELAPFYRGADLFVFPSYREGMPNVVLEAMSCGLPVIMRSSCQGAEELIHENGVSVEDDFVAALQEMIQCGTEQMVEMGKQSRRIAETFSWEHTATQYEDLLKSIVTTGREDR